MRVYNPSRMHQCNVIKRLFIIPLNKHIYKDRTQFGTVLLLYSICNLNNTLFLIGLELTLLGHKHTPMILCPYIIPRAKKLKTRNYTS